MMEIVREAHIYSGFNEPPQIHRQIWPSALAQPDDYDDVVPTLVMSRPAPLIIPEFEDNIIPELVPPIITQSIPRFVAEAMKRDSIATGATCPITTNTFEVGTEVAVTSCYHLFEAAALNIWISTHMLCPICKSTLTSDPVIV